MRRIKIFILKFFRVKYRITYKRVNEGRFRSLYGMRRKEAVAIFEAKKRCKSIAYCTVYIRGPFFLSEMPLWCYYSDEPKESINKSKTKKL